MIYKLSGIVRETHPQTIILDTGALWFELHVPTETMWQLGKQADVYTYIHWNQELGPSFYGFATVQEKQLFLLVISCSGVGPKLGLAVLAELGIAQFVTAIQQHDERMLSKVTGIGQRKAEQIIVQLRHKIDAIAQQLAITGATTPSAQHVDWQLLSQTLETLRYSRLEITRAIGHLRTTNTQEQSFDQLIKTALTYLTKTI